MMQTLGVVQIRPTSSGDSIYRRSLGGKSVLEWVIRQVTECQQLDGAIVITGDTADERDVAALVPSDVPIFVSSHQDAIKRYLAALDQYRAKTVVRVCADNPFIDPALIDRLITTAKENSGWDYITYCSRSGRPVIDSPLGVYAELFAVKALRRADQLANSPDERSDVTAFLRNHPEEFPMRLVALPEGIDRDDFRFCLSDVADWELTQELFEAIGPDQLDWQNIADFLEHQPDMRRRMASMNEAAR